MGTNLSGSQRAQPLDLRKVDLFYFTKRASWCLSPPDHKLHFQQANWSNKIFHLQKKNNFESKKKTRTMVHCIKTGHFPPAALYILANNYVTLNTKQTFTYPSLYPILIINFNIILSIRPHVLYLSNKIFPNFKWTEYLNTTTFCYVF